MADEHQTTVGRIDLGPTEPRHMTQTEQRIMDAALRRSVKVLPDPETERLRAEVARLRAALVGARKFAQWPAGAAELKRVTELIDDALAATP